MYKNVAVSFLLCLCSLLHAPNCSSFPILLCTETWPEAKASGKYLFGQVPALEIEDGTILVQCPAIISVCLLALPLCLHLFFPLAVVHPRCWCVP